MIHTPTARLSLAARSYLASISVSMLVLLALHLSIQAWSQQQAQQWVAAWEKQYGGHVGEVRLHMLRGALSIHDIQWQASTDKTGEEATGIEFYAPFVLLRGNLSASIQQVEIREVMLQEAKLVLPKQFFQQTLQQKKALAAWLPWADLLDSVRLVHAENLDLMIRETPSEEGSSPPINITHGIFFSAPKQQHWNLSGDMWGGVVDVQRQNDDVRMAFSELKAQSVSKYLGLSALDGLVSGKGLWEKSERIGKLSGDIEWQGEEEGKLTFLGSYDEDGWQGEAQAMNWPLHTFAASAPVFNHRILATGYLQGLLQVEGKGQGDAQSWQLHLQEGNIYHLSYQSQSDVDWYIQQLTMQEAVLTWPQRSLNIESIDMQKGQWRVNSVSSDAEAVEGKAREQVDIQSRAWKFKLPKIHFSSMQVGDVSKNIWLNDVQGNASLLGKTIILNASTSSDITGKWKLQVQGSVANKYSAMDLGLSLKLEATTVPLRYFRDALPQNLVQDSSLNGNVDLQLAGFWNSQGWQLQGDANGKNIMWNRGAWLWQADRVLLKDISFSSRQAPHVKSLKATDWSGQTSLKPWSQAMGVLDANNATSPHISAPFTLDDWQLEHVTLEQGRFSLGKAESVWFEADTINLVNLHEGQDIVMRLRGKLADGDFSFDGIWFPWGQVPWLTFDASLKHALPFRVAAWLKNSKLPVFNRGRISADIKIRPMDQQPQHYQGLMNLTLSHAQLQDGVFTNQSLSDFTGYTAHALFDRIRNGGNVHLQVPLQGNWVNTPFSSYSLGQALLASLADKATEAEPDHYNETVLTLPSIRLHDSTEGHHDKLKHNERVRLRKTLHLLQAEKAWRIELIPELGQSMLDESLLYRVRQTQQQIETFLTDRGISPARIFPVWPEQISRQGESTGILIRAVK
ncbi:MAG: hypothetical protein Q9M20_02820 [Mariprofundaceae bacterium]|nr:hypothetical protein [Mariprofundaceae bacterium]